MDALWDFWKPTGLPFAFLTQSGASLEPRERVATPTLRLMAHRFIVSKLCLVRCVHVVAPALAAPAVIACPVWLLEHEEHLALCALALVAHSQNPKSDFHASERGTGISGSRREVGIVRGPIGVLLHDLRRAFE